MRITKESVVKIKQRMADGTIIFNLERRNILIALCDSWLRKEREIRALKKKFFETQRFYEDYIKTYVDKKGKNQDENSN